MYRFSSLVSKLISHYLPSASVIAVLLTFVVIFLGVVVQSESPINMIDHWGTGFWNLLSFSMQMVLILVTGGALARSSMVDRFLTKIAMLPQNNTQATLLTTTISCLACLINWGFGLIVSALLAVNLVKKNQGFNKGLILASSYSGFLLWHGGLSGSIPLKLTSPSESIQGILGTQSLSLNETIFSPLNLILILCVFIVLIITNSIMGIFSTEKMEQKVNNISTRATDKNKNAHISNRSFGRNLEHSKVLTFCFLSLGTLYLVSRFVSGEGLELNTMIFIFLFLGISLHGDLASYQEAFKESLSSSTGIIIQFPLYAGIMGMMSSSGLAQTMSEFFVSISTPTTFLVNTFISAGILNFFVPSGGGQWVIQGPIVLGAAKELGISLPKAALAIAWGDAWTNMIQPFWALPLLSIANIELSRVMSYLLMIFVCVGASISLIFTFY